MKIQWIDALEFDNYGGFIPETQFVREMGQGYLLADAVGTPVAPAEVRFNVEESGMYRIWIRTKNWCVGYEPDGIVVAVDGKKSMHVCGKMHVEKWYFEIAGDFYLEIGEHILSIHDTDGWFGRFASVIIANDYGFTPSPELSRMKKQRLAIRKEEVDITNHGKYDMIVVGAGVAGITAAITAARKKLRVALVNDRPMIGGNGSEEGSVTLEGAAHRGYHETGIIYEIKNYRHKENVTWTQAFNHFVEKEPTLEVFQNLLIDDAEVEENRILSIHGVNTYNLSQHVFTADLYVDGTGDAWLGYYAGAQYRVGREAEFEYGESYAPECADGNTMSGCATKSVTDGTDTICSYIAENVDYEVKYIAPDWAFEMPKGDAMSRTPKTIFRGEWWLENRNDYDDIWESEYVRDAMIRLAAGYFDWLKNSWDEKEKTKHLKLKAFGTYNAKRESRRLLGDYVLTQNDYNGATNFEDAVCYSGWNIDVHHIDGIFSGKGSEFDLNEVVPITPIPLRALYSRNIKNLMMVGRCISVSHIGLGPTRVQLTGATMGQAVGTAAFLCKKYHTLPACVSVEHIKELQQILLKDGQYIPGIFNEDKEDLAKQAIITADSYEEYGKPACVANGKTRATDGLPYAWISKDGLPQSIYLRFDEPKTVKEVRITLDMPFADYPQGYLPQPSPDNVITDLVVEVKEKTGYRIVGTVDGNYQRLLVLEFEPVITDCIRITAKKVLNGSRAIIPEIRVY